MRKVVKKLIWIGLIILIVAFICAVYPLYVHWVAGNYTKKFAVVLNSHDIKQYDKFFFKDTVFELNGEEIEYSKARENMEKVQEFSCGSSYGNESLVTNVYFKKEYDVGLMLPIIDYNNGKGFATLGILEADITLERRWIFFFRIKKVSFYDDKEGFLENFLGIGKGENASEEATDPVIMRVAGWNMEYTPIDRKLTVEDFDDVELGDTYSDMVEKVGYDLYKLVVFDGDNQDYVLKSVNENDIK